MPFTPPADFACFHVRKTGADRFESGVERRPFRELPPGEVLIRVSHSSLNYKDALAATGHAGIARKFPHVPGIDAAGVVVESASDAFHPGDEVIATGHELGVERWGGWSEFVRVPAAWVVTRPPGLSLAESMILGTAGFTAAQCVLALQHHGIAPDRGEVVVTGATGGVGTIAVMLLAKLGYRVVAVTGKSDRADWLMQLGAGRVVGREAVLDESERPLLGAQWAGGVDTVGGQTLTTLVRSLQHRGCVAACGVVGGANLPLTVYPFILRGATLAGIDSAWCPDDRRAGIWTLLAGDWKLAGLERIANTIGLKELPAAVDDILHGRIAGRVVVKPSNDGTSSD